MTMAEEAAPEEEGKGKGKSALIATIGAAIALSLVGAGGGWVIGGMLAPKVEEHKAAEEAKKEEAGEVDAKAEGAEGKGGESPAKSTLYPLDAVTTNLSYPSDNWIRIEVSLEFTGAVDEDLARDIHQDMMSYLRTVSLQQIEGPRGFQYLREDLRERVRLRSEGRINDLLFRTFVIE